jgi:hypothetical protein
MNTQPKVKKQAYDHLRMLLHLLGLTVLIMITLFFLFMMESSVHYKDPEARLFVAFLGEVGAAFFVPFLAMYGRKIPLLILLPLLAMALFGLLDFNAWIECRVAGGTGFGYYCWPVLCSLPGLFALREQRYILKKKPSNQQETSQLQAHEDGVWPPPPSRS